MTKAIALFTAIMLVPACDFLGDGSGSSGNNGTGSYADNVDDTSKNSGESGNMLGMTEAHNGYRKEEHSVNLVWNSDVAAYAQEWAEYLRDNHDCELQHRSWLGMAVQSYGENLYGSSVWGMGLNTTPQKVVDAWWGEISDYDYASNSCTAVCGHYTQVMWKGSTEVGCGMAVCDEGANAQSDVWVCNYDPPGNWIGQRPW